MGYMALPSNWHNYNQHYVKGKKKMRKRRKEGKIKRIKPFKNYY